LNFDSSFVQSFQGPTAFDLLEEGITMLSNALEPVLTQVLTNLIELCAILLFAALGAIWRTLYRYLVTHLTAKQIGILELLSNQAYALVEADFKSLSGSQKMEEALQYIQTEAQKRNIPFRADAARAAIEHAWMQFEGQYKKQAALK
jgi:hypothetical protein